jgi:voltage-gated potassium channel
MAANRLRYRVHQLLNDSDERSGAARAAQIFLVVLITLNVAAVMVDTIEGVSGAWERWLWAFEVFSVVVFSVEYVLRLWVVVERPKFVRPVVGRLRWMLTPLAILDLASIVPFYVPMLTLLDLRFLRALRLLRLMRLLKVGRYSRSLRVLRDVLLDRKDELLATLSLMVIAAIMSSGAMYLVEHEAQPETFSSMPATVWWAVSTMTMISDDGMKPVTVPGKMLAAVIGLCGIGLFGLPTGIIGSGFVDKYMDWRGGRRCPHCGKKVSASPGPDEKT